MYSSKIIKAGALLTDTKILLDCWNPSLSPRENLHRIHTENLFGKASRSRVEDILAIFRQRYLYDPAVAPALSTLMHGGIGSQALDRILYFYAARSDPLLHDVVADLLAPLYRQGRIEITPGEIESFLRDHVRSGRTAGRWSEETVRRVARGLLATLRDFGVLTGSVRKLLAMPYLPTRAFACIAFVLNQELRSGERVLNSPEWRLFFLQLEVVERLFVEAHQEGLLQYHAAGRVIRLDFPASSLEDYARALTQRTD